MKFSEMNLNQNTIKALISMFGDNASPTEIQERSIPHALEGNNIIAQAKTGSGKTLAFSIPIIEKMEFLPKPEALILVPTRELCKQVAEVFNNLKKYTKDVNLVEVYGGVSINPQIEKLERGANVIVATPGRLIDLYERDSVDFSALKFLVLDEADRMLDMGFFPDIQYIFGKIDSNPQLLLFSATILDEIKVLSNQFTKGQYVDIDVSHDSLTVDQTNQYYYLIPNFKDKIYNFIRVLRNERPKHCLIFVNTKRTADWLLKRLLEERGLGLKIGLLSGNMSQFKREQITKKFKNHEINCLIATDVAARGLDIPNVSHVFNYDIPQYEENYVHRIGRTSRMGKKGTAITMVLEEEYIYLCRIESFINKSIKKKPLLPRNQNNSGRNSSFNNNSFNRSNRNNRNNRNNRSNTNKRTNNNRSRNFNNNKSGNNNKNFDNRKGNNHNKQFNKGAKGRNDRNGGNKKSNNSDSKFKRSGGPLPFY